MPPSRKPAYPGPERRRKRRTPTQISHTFKDERGRWIKAFVSLTLKQFCRLFCACTHSPKHNARKALFRAVGDPMSDVIFHVGDAPRTFNLDLLKPDETIDTTYETPRFGYDSADSGTTAAEDGSSSFSVSGLRVTVTPLAPSALDENGNPIASVVWGDADADDLPEGQAIVSASLNVTVLAVNVDADHAVFTEVA